MALRDDILSGESYYIAEILATKRILDAAEAGEPVLCAVDGNSTANVSAAQMEAYVGSRAAAGAAVKLTLADGGARRTLELRP